MIDRKISDLTILASPSVNDLLPIVDVSVSGFETKQITVSNLVTGGIVAPADPQYVTLAAHAGLTNERILTGTANQITVTDGGAGLPVTLSFPNVVAINTNLITRGVLNVGGVSRTFADGTGQIALLSSDAWAIDLGGSVVFGGAVSGADLQRTFGAIAGRKENNVLNNRAGYLSFGTRTIVGADDIVEAMRITSIQDIVIGNTVAAAKVHIDQFDADANKPALLLDQADISEGFINFIGSDRGVIAGATASVESVRVELGGVIRRLALYNDA